MKKYARSYLVLLGAILLGIVAGVSNQAILVKGAEVISKLFINYLSMIAAPIVMLAIFSTLISMGGLDQVKRLTRRLLFYTLLTTVLAALVALGCFLVFDPVSFVQKGAGTFQATASHSYIDFLVDIVPSNIFQAFLDNKVISVAFLGFLFGITAHFLPEDHRKTLQKGFSALFQLFLKVAQLVVYGMPIAVWAFTTILTRELQEKSAEVSGLWAYLGVVVFANIIQGLIVIPLLLKARGLSPWRIAKGASKALLVAFFTKSSNAALPVGLKAAKEELGMDPKVAGFSLPLCTVINMNGCAAFILTTVLFVAGANGHIFSPLDLAFWVFMSVLAAVGNAGVPMGCFFLSSALLIGMDVPLTMMGLILPFYALIDMEETALNVWSDISVVSIVDKECKESLQELPV